jgi:hypothetical protein
MTKKRTWENFWADFQSEQEWRFPEVPPWQIHRYLGYPMADHSESLRAEWLWRHRPREIMGRGVFGYVVLIVISILLLLIPLFGLCLEAAWLFTCFMLIASDVVRNVRWRRDYEVSLCRLIRTTRRPELM